MRANGWLQILLFLALVVLGYQANGIYMTRVFQQDLTAGACLPSTRT